MTSNVDLLLHKSALRCGSIITGTIILATTGSRRKASDFVITLALEASLLTSIPSSSGIFSHSDKLVHSSSQVIDGARAVSSPKALQIPFAFLIPSKCPISTQCSTIAQLRHKFVVRVRDLSAPFLPALTAAQAAEILPALEADMALATTFKQKKLSYTASQVLAPGTSHFIQMTYPISHSVSDCRATIMTDTTVTDKSASFSKKTERPLRETKLIHRQMPDGQTGVSVLEAVIPELLECSINVEGFVRKHSVVVYLSLENRSSVVLTIPVTVQSAPVQKALPAVPTETPVSAAPKAPMVPFKAPRLAPIPSPKSARRQSHTAAMPVVQAAESRNSHLRHLSMNALTRKALHDSTTTPIITTTTPTSPISSRKSSLTTGSLSPAGSIRSSSSSDRNSLSASSVSSAPSSPRSAPSPFDFSSPPTLGSSRRQEKGRSALLRFGQKLTFAKTDMEFSCCGPAATTTPVPSGTVKGHKKRHSLFDTFSFPSSRKASLPAALEVTTPVAATDRTSLESSVGGRPGEYLSAPPSPTTSTCSSSSSSSPAARRREGRLSFRRLSSQSGHGKPVFQDRYSISDEYLAGFKFDGLSSLDDDAPLEQHDHLRDEEDDDDHEEDDRSDYGSDFSDTFNTYKGIAV